VDLGTPDLDASIRFYGEVFGWECDRGGPEVGGYSTFTKDGQSVAGVGPLMNEQQPIVWTTYLCSFYIDATANRVADAGGTVISPPMDVMDLGKFAIVTDPAGAAFGVWQPGTMPGADLTGATGALSWNELQTRDVDGAKAFYPEVFGLSVRDLPGSQPPYTLFQVGDAPVAGMILMDERWPAEIPPHWMVFFGVDDCDAAVKVATDLGGSVSVPPTDTPAGRFAVLADPQSAPFSVIKVNPDYVP
jgi:predicted enzyme related to lactoylglutathione lyase